MKRIAYVMLLLSVASLQACMIKAGGYDASGDGQAINMNCAGGSGRSLRTRLPHGVELVTGARPNEGNILIRTFLVVPKAVIVSFVAESFSISSPEWTSPRRMIISRLRGLKVFLPTDPVPAGHYDLDYFSARGEDWREVPAAGSFTIQYPALSINGTIHDLAPITFRAHERDLVLMCPI